jgi:hypothetical protein
VDHARGTMENPLTPDEIHRKYLKLATTVTTAARADQIAEAVRQIDRSSGVARLAGLLRRLPPAGPRGGSGRTGRSQHRKTQRA